MRSTRLVWRRMMRNAERPVRRGSPKALVILLALLAFFVAGAVNRDRITPAELTHLVVPASTGAAGQGSQRQLAALPAAAKAAVSEALGSESREFRAHRVGNGYELTGAGVTAQINARGTTLRSGRMPLRMSVGGI